MELRTDSLFTKCMDLHPEDIDSPTIRKAKANVIFFPFSLDLLAITRKSYNPRKE